MLGFLPLLEVGHELSLAYLPHEPVVGRRVGAATVAAVQDQQQRVQGTEQLVALDGFEIWGDEG